MKDEKTDRRSRHTRDALGKSLLPLLQKKPLKGVTIAELCRGAGVSRGTFYNHFDDVFDVYDSIENEFYEEIMERIAGIKTYDLDSAFFREIISFISLHAELTAMLVRNQGESTLLRRIVRPLREKYVGEFSERCPALPAERIQAVFTYTMNGSVGIVMEWIQTGLRAPQEDIAELVETFNRAIVDHVLKTAAE